MSVTDRQTDGQNFRSVQGFATGSCANSGSSNKSVTKSACVAGDAAWSGASGHYCAWLVNGLIQRGIGRLLADAGP